MSGQRNHPAVCVCCTKNEVIFLLFVIIDKNPSRKYRKCRFFKYFSNNYVQIVAKLLENPYIPMSQPFC